MNPGFRVGRCDLTYFLLHQSDVIRKAIDSLHDYIARKTRGTRENQGLLRDMRQLNLRQQALAGHASRHPGTVHTIGGHQRSHDTAYNTAQTDLLSLAEKGLFLKAESGKRKAESGKRKAESGKRKEYGIPRECRFGGGRSKEFPLKTVIIDVSFRERHRRCEDDAVSIDF